jgi:hypothetical protein
MITAINLKITNNVPLELPISILGVIQDPNGFNNIKTVYEFDMSGETFSSFLFVFAYSTIAQPSVNISYFFNNPTPTIQGYVDDLNTLNVGYFTYNGTTIYMLSNNYIGKSIKI